MALASNFPGWSEATLLATIASANSVKAGGGIITGVGSGDVNSQRIAQYTPDQIIRMCKQDLYFLAPSTYPEFAFAGQNKVVARFA